MAISTFETLPKLVCVLERQSALLGSDLRSCRRYYPDARARTMDGTASAKSDYVQHLSRCGQLVRAVPGRRRDHSCPDARRVPADNNQPYWNSWWAARADS